MFGAKMLDQISYICLHATDLTVIRGHTKVPLEKFIACNGCTRYTMAMFLIYFPNFYSLNLKVCNSFPKCCEDLIKEVTVSQRTPENTSHFTSTSTR